MIAVLARIGSVEKLEDFDELAAAVALPDERVDLAGEQIDPGQQAERAMAFVLMIAREARVDGLALAANPAPSLRWPGFPASRRKRRSPPTCSDFLALAATFFRTWTSR